MKLELANASRDQISGAVPEWSIAIESAHALIPRVYAANQRWMALAGRETQTHAASARRSSGTMDPGSIVLAWSTEDQRHVRAANAMAVG